VCDIFGTKLTTACVQAIGITSTNVTNTELTGAAASLTGTVARLWAGPMKFVLGAEHRHSAAKYEPDFFLSTGDVAGFNPSAPTSGSESVTEGFGEVHVPLLAQLPLVDSLSVNGAFRYSGYDLPGLNGVWTYSGGGNWRVMQDIGFRGQFQHAIRAPNVGELYGGQTTVTSVITDPCSVAPANSQQAAAVRAICIAQGVKAADVFTSGIQPNPYIPNTTGGNPLLTAETSDTKTIGVVLTPRFLPAFSLAADWYSIDVSGAIAQLSGGIGGVFNTCYQQLLNAGSAYCQAVQRDPGTGQIVNVNVGLANAGALKTEGVDFEVSYAHELGWGLLRKGSTLRLASEWNYVTEYTLVPIKDRPSINYQCVGAYGPTCGEPFPRLKGVTRVTWGDGPLDLSLRYRFVDSVTVDKYLLPLRSGTTVPPLNTLTNPVLPSAHYIDLSFSWDVNEGLELSGGVNNVFNWGPPIVGSSAGYGNTWPATYDPYGQTFFLDARLKF
jgi:outer membrane receptor protein involved in Fe transport